MATAGEVIARGIVKSFQNTPETFPVNRTELVEQVWKLLVWIFDAVAAENAAFLETTVAVPSVGGAWARPADAYTVTLLERASSGEEVDVLPYRERRREAGIRPAVYERAGQWFPAGNVGDPDLSEQLLVTYAPSPARPIDENSVLDSRIPDRYHAAIEFGIAAHVARKDTRPEDAAQFEEEAKGWLTLLLAHAQRVSANESRQAGYALQFPAKQSTPVPDRG